MSRIIPNLSSIRHPDYKWDSDEWYLWRCTFEGGQAYLDNYLQKWSGRETEADYLVRKSITPIPTFAKAALLDVRNSIYQRLSDVSRLGGSKAYSKAMAGENGGVDRKGSSMGTFIGKEVLTELLLMGRVGIFVDAPSVVPSTLATQAQAPYLYVYAVEDIISWTLEKPENPGQFKAVLLRDYSVGYQTEFGVELPNDLDMRYRLMWKDDETGKVHYKLMDEDKRVIFLPDSREDGSVVLDIEVVPFVLADIGDSLMKDAASYQNALLNLASGDVSWALRSNTPFLTIQEDLRTAASHLKPAGDAATPGSQRASNRSENVGTGRYYDKDTDRPGFIAPPTAPLEASMKLQEKLEDDIRKLINLAVANKTGSRTESAEAKKLSSQGLEAGLSFIGMVLSQSEQHIAQLWAMYEDFSNPNVATVSYPKRYILKTDDERIKESNDLLDLMERIPGKNVKKSLAKLVVTNLLSDREGQENILKMIEEIDSSPVISTELDFILRSQEAGLLGDETASKALGFDASEVNKAKKDHADRAIRVLAAQQSNKGQDQPDNPASRGVGLDNGGVTAQQEQAAGRQKASVK